MRKFTLGRTYCPLCGEIDRYEIRSCTPDGWPSKVYCRSCGKTFTYPTPGEFQRRADERKKRFNRSGWHKRYRDEHKDDRREYSRQYYWDHHATILRKYAEKNADKHPTRVCPTCGSEFVAKHGNHKYCRPECKNASEPARLHKKRWRVRERERVKWLETRVAELEGQLAEVGA